MLGAQSNKCLITIVKDFKGEFDNELTVNTGDKVQFVSKIDRYWYEVYSNGLTGKVPLSSCREWSSTEMSSIKLVRLQQTAFIAKYDFCTECMDGDLRFSAGELLIGFEKVNDDWWHGTRFDSILNNANSLSVKDENCGIFPLTHVWPLRKDLLPDYCFSDTGINIESLSPSSDTLMEDVPIEAFQKTDNENSTILQNGRNYLFYVKVVKTMKARLAEEMDLPEIDEVLGVSSIPTNLYFSGQSLDGLRVGMFPQSFVSKLENYEPNGDPNSTSSSPVPSPNPPSMPPPSPPSITIDFGKTLSINFGGSLNQNLNKVPLDTPPSYEAAISCEPVSYGYANHMFSGIESYGRVLFNFEAQNDNELSLRENQIVRLHRHADDEWMEGEVDGQIGFFPKSYISIIVDCEGETVDDGANESKATPATQVQVIDYPFNTRAKILYDFDPEMDQDLRVRAGDIVTLLKRFTSTDWVEAMNATGNVGFVHLNFCELINPAVTSSTPTLETAGYSNYANLNSQLRKLEGPSKGIIPSETGLKDDSLAGAKPQRPAPAAPKRTNVFPTFNQFLFDEKQEILQYELEHDQVSAPSEQPTTVSNTSETTKDTSTASTAKNKRQCVITELIQTERDYCNAMNVCLNVFRSSSMEAERCNVDVEKLFGDMKTVVDVSKRLLKLLDNYANNRAYIDQRVGVCFLDLKFEIKDAYTRYCRNHDSSSIQLRLYEADSKSSEFMRRCQSKIQNQTNCFDVASILIKPVQRILKYPLLINELIKCTEENHIDWDPLLMALQMITDIATSINEHKRRHDLIQKYCKETDTSFSGKLKNLNKHTVMKKSSRLANRVISTLTFSSVHKDEHFDAAFARFIALDKSIKIFAKSMKDYLNNLNEYYMQSLVVANAILEYYGQKREVEELRSTHHEIYTKYFAEFRASIEKNVINSLSRLTDKFKAPWILINKRKDKLVDYDASLKSKNSDSNLAKNTFEALNQQLIEELPLLTDLSLQIFTNCLQAFMSANKKLICRTANIFLNLHQLPFIKNSPFGFYQDIEEAFRVKHNLIFTQMLHDFSLIHTSAFPNVNVPLSEAAMTSTLSRLHIHRSSNTWKNSLPARKSPQADSIATNERKRQEERNKQSLLSKYKPQDLYVVTATSSPSDIFELYAETEDLIGVIKRKDPTGQEHRWFVDRGTTQGFLPKSILTPYRRPIDLLQSQPSMESCSSLVSSRSSDRSNSLLSYENVDLLTEHRYDTVPEEFNTSNNSSLLSFEEIDHPACIETNHSLLDTSEFDPLTSQPVQKSNSPIAVAAQPNDNLSSDSVYQAAYPFKAADQNQLTLEFGQRVIVKQKADLQGNSEWWLVENTLGQKGYVPANYLRKS